MYKKTRPRKERFFTFRSTHDFYRLVKARAKQEGTTMTELVTRLVEKELKPV